MAHRRLANLLQQLLLRDDVAIYRQLLIVLLLCLGLGLIFIGSNQSTPQSKIQTTENCGVEETVVNLQTPVQIAEVIVESGITRTAPNDEATRLTPLPKGTKATVTSIKGDWLRLGYGAWIHRQEMQTLVSNTYPQALVCDISYRKLKDRTEVIFPLGTPVPISVKQSDRIFTLTLHNTTAKNNIVTINNDPIISRIFWQQEKARKVKYTLNLKNTQQWGYKLKYEENKLILTLRHSPFTPTFTPVSGFRGPLSGIKIVLDPGHGGMDSGAKSPEGYLEKDVNLIVTKLLREQLELRGAVVYLTREDDVELSLADRVARINTIEPAIALSIHYNHANTVKSGKQVQGVGTYWYHPQAVGMAKFLQKYMVQNLGRPSDGVRWKNLALARPTIAPSVLLELGYLSHPEELQWIIDPYEQQNLAMVLADGIVEWFSSTR
ncbi:MAG: N-acetylmuramoyl-L-alanine amidase [Calothrix sp. MO_192.B10]|nr:N-acetylmuramoyl-L-alanine amidase [Calothrix sp. MO_192.B10]